MAEIKTTQVENKSSKLPIKLLTQYFKYVPIAMFLLIVCACFLFFIKPKYENITRNIDEDIKKNEAAYEEYKVYFDKANKLIRNYNKLGEKDIERLDMILPSAPEEGSLMVQAELIAAMHGASLDAFTLAAKENKNSPEKKAAGSGKIGTVDIQLDLSGVDYGKLKRLLAAFARNIRILDITSVNYSPSSQSLSLTATAYYFVRS